MTGPELVRPVPVEQAEPWLRTLITALLGDPHGDHLDARLERTTADWDAGRTWGYREHGRWVATLATRARTVTVPGPGGAVVDVPMDALTGVSVSATHRRRGLLRAMLTEALQAARDRGDPLTGLLAAEWPIYGRFGYAPATWLTDYRYLPRRAGAQVPGDVGRVRQLEPAEVAAIAPAVFEAARRRRAGQLDRPGPWWPFQLGVDGFTGLPELRCTWLVHEGPDGPDGLLAWKVKRDFHLTGELGAITVTHFVDGSDAAYRDLWAYLGGIDAIDEVHLLDRPVDEPARWLMADGRSLVRQDGCDFLWLRLLDVPAALSARGYAVDGEVVLEIDDPAPGAYGAGRFRLTVRDGVGGCVPTSAEPDLRLPQRLLASIYLGGHRLREFDVTGDVRERTPGSRDLVDLMFGTPVAPWNATAF